MRYFISFALFALISLSVFAQTSSNPGLLVMAHGGSPEWNQAVMNAVDPLASNQPTAIAFGMAHPDSLQAAIIELEEAGATSIHVVRLFISSASFLVSTEYAFGISDRAPQHDSSSTTQPRKLLINVPVEISGLGLMDASVVGDILSLRASKLSLNPEKETVLIVGHGPGSDTENEIWLKRMDTLADNVREAASFHRVVVNTLREDWTGKREVVEKELRALVASEKKEDRSVVIIPFRLFGFGPYAEVFEGLSYRADSTGILPDIRISEWIDEQFQCQLTADGCSVTDFSESDSVSSLH